MAVTSNEDLLQLEVGLQSHDGATKMIDTVAKSGNFPGGITGNLTGNASGSAASATLATDVSAPTPVVVSAASGAIAIPTNRLAVYHITYNGGAGGYTIVDPATPGDDGKEIEIVTETAQAHVLTDATNGFNGKAASGTITWTAAKGNSTRFRARNGLWWVTVKNGVAVA